MGRDNAFRLRRHRQASGERRCAFPQCQGTGRHGEPGLPDREPARGPGAVLRQFPDRAQDASAGALLGTLEHNATTVPPAEGHHARGHTTLPGCTGAQGGGGQGNASPAGRRYDVLLRGLQHAERNGEETDVVSARPWQGAVLLGLRRDVHGEPCL